MSQGHASDTEAAHPLVPLVIRRLEPGARVIVLGAGSGRNLSPLLRAGASVDVVEPVETRRRVVATRFAAAIDAQSLALLAELREPGVARYDALLSTHALLHGTPLEIGRLVSDAVSRLKPEAPIYATFGSRGDPRFGAGTRIDDSTWAPLAGSEIGVPHAFFTRAALIELLAGVEIEELAEVSARDTAGSWAHDASESATMRHWFAIARKRAGGRAAPE